MKQLPDIAVIGAGIAGLQLARSLADRASVRIFEKSRGYGGRMSTRRGDSFHFDHGAQYFTAHGAEFQRFLEPYLKAGTVARWTPRLSMLGGGQAPVWHAPRYVAVPGMNALAKAMAADLSIAIATRIATIRREGSRWRLTSETGDDCGAFDWVISTAPAEQSVRLLPDAFRHLDRLAAARTLGCYSLMIGLSKNVNTPWDAAVVQGSPLAWVAMNNSKPGRPQATSILCQSANDWAEQHMDEDPSQIQDILCAAFEDATGLSCNGAAYLGLHKWRFAKVATPCDGPFLLDAENRLAAAGDWCGAGRVESGFDSADALARIIKGEYL